MKNILCSRLQACQSVLAVGNLKKLKCKRFPIQDNFIKSLNCIVEKKFFNKTKPSPISINTIHDEFELWSNKEIDESEILPHLFRFCLYIPTKENFFTNDYKSYIEFINHQTLGSKKDTAAIITTSYSFTKEKELRIDYLRSRENGYGTKLLTALIFFIKGKIIPCLEIDSMSLIDENEKDNAHIPLYEKFGFVKMFDSLSKTMILDLDKIKIIEEGGEKFIDIYYS